MKHRYKITVKGTGIQEYYEFNHRKSTSEVAKIWLNDAAQNWGQWIKLAFEGKVEVEELTDGEEPPELP